MTKLSVNLNKIALLRNARDHDQPNILQAARTAISAGAYGITVHPRPDQRHIMYKDVYDLKTLLTDEYPNIEFNIEGNPFTGKFLDIIKEVKPHQATLVPDTPGQKTSDHGWDLQTEKQRLEPLMRQLLESGTRVSLFMDANLKGLEIAAKLGAHRIELYTEPYAKAFADNQNIEQVVRDFAQTAKSAQQLGLGVNAGHDLNRQNLKYFLQNVPDVLEVSIGQAIIVDAIDMGLYNAVNAYLEILEQI